MPCTCGKDRSVTCPIHPKVFEENAYCKATKGASCVVGRYWYFQCGWTAIDTKMEENPGYNFCPNCGKKAKYV